MNRFSSFSCETRYTLILTINSFEKRYVVRFARKLRGGDDRNFPAARREWRKRMRKKHPTRFIRLGTNPLISQEHFLITTPANSISPRLPFNAAGLYALHIHIYMYIRELYSPINPALSAGLIPWWNQFTVGGCYTYRARAVIKLLLQADRTPIDMGGHRTPTLALFPPPSHRCIYGPFILGAHPLLITRDILMNLWKRHHPLRFITYPGKMAWVETRRRKRHVPLVKPPLSPFVRGRFCLKLFTRCFPSTC